MRILFARFASGADFLTHYDDRLSWGGLVLSTRAAPRFEEPIVIEVSFPLLVNRVLLRAHAVDREDRGDGPLLRVKFLPSELGKRDYLLAVASGEHRPAWRRRHRRFPLRLPLRLGLPGSSARSEVVTEDLSAAGLFVRTPLVLPVGAAITLEIGHEPGACVELCGQVAWVRQRPPSAGLGVSLDAASRRRARELRDILRGLKTSGASAAG